ncbi:hypothetical protein COCOBI_11-1940 [Coccomyxa sp. Obi]|nr:hypothetical protein COCOBI_11-1940 [Coccomyxa sp. Obi]
MPGKSFVTGGKTPGLGRRKALGNITNTERKPVDTAPALKPRKALGDITNATPVQPSHANTKKSDANVKKPALPLAHAKEVALQRLADIYAEDGIERMAGKTWRELEKEQRQRDDAEIEERVRAINSAPYRMPFSVFGRRRRQDLTNPVHVPQPPSPPPTPHNSLDLDDLPALDSLLLQPPIIDWTFGGSLKEESSQHSTEQAQSAEVAAAVPAIGATDAAAGPD